MKEHKREQVSGGAAEPDIRLGQVCLFFDSIPFSIQAILLTSFLLSYLIWEVTSHRAILGWLSLVSLVSLVRLWQYRQFTRKDPTVEKVAHWWNQALLSATMSAITWAAASLFLFPPESLLHQLLFTFLVAGIAAGAVTTLSSIFPAILLFLLIDLLPLSWRFMMSENHQEQLIGAMAVFFMLLLLLSARRLNETIMETLTMRHEKSRAEATIRHQALYDELTDLPNRRLMYNQLNREIARSSRHGHLGAILFLDLDYFKNVNDSLGHAVGDKLLQQVAARLTGRLRNEDTVSRLGGDEFVILLPEIANNADQALTRAHACASDLRQLFQEPFLVEGHTLHISASIGIVLFPLDESTPGDLLQQADVAMYRAKDEGRDGFCLFHPGMQEELEARLKIQRGLRRALCEDQLELYYQPQVDVQGRILGAEALVRWHHPRLGLVSPADFIPIAEETGLIYQLGDWVLETACRHIRQLSEQAPLVISINISPKQFREPAFVEHVKEVVEKSGIDPGLLHLEITEGTVLDNVEQSIAHMESLKECGIGFSIDDFGTGYSSLAYLKRLPIEALKIDRSFVLDVIDDRNDAVLVETIIVMARHLGLEVIAEGVETREVLSFLAQKGCRKFQGYLFSRPVPFAKLTALEQPLLQEQRPCTPAPASAAG